MSRTGAAVVAATALLALTACSSGSDASPSSSASSTPPSAGPTAASSSTSSPTTEPSPTTGTPSPVPVITQSPGTLVVRPSSKPSNERIDAKPSSFAKPVVYPDGMVVRVSKISQTVVTASGPGEITGQPMTRFTITITNGTSAPLALDQVVVSAFYSSPTVRALSLIHI